MSTGSVTFPRSRLGGDVGFEAASVMRSPLEVEQPPGILRKVGEGLLYIPVLLSAFAEPMGLGQTRYLVGGVHLACTILVFFTVLLARERVPISVWFALLICFMANISQSIGNGEPPLTGEGLPLLLFYTGNLMATCFVVRNAAAMKRVILFFAVLLIILPSIGGEFIKGTGGVKRLELEGVAGMLSNANVLSYTTGLFSVALLFWSLRAKHVLRPVLWALSLALMVVMLQTVSRAGLAIFAVGVMVYVMTILAGRGMRLGGLVFICIVILAASQFAYLVADQFLYYQKRARVDTATRLGVFSLATVHDMMETFLFGRGPSDAYSSATGISPHNSFLYVHFAFGGITAYPYLAWLIMLSIRVMRMLRAGDFPIEAKMFLVALYLMAVGGEATNNANFTLYSSVFAWAIIEKYTQPYSHKRMAQREAESASAAPPAAPMLAPAVRGRTVRGAWRHGA